MQKSTILIVDDDADVLTAARLFLKQHFAKVIVNNDPENIPGICAEEQIDVFLLDMNFAIGKNSGAEGLSWLRYLLEQDANAVVILMTAFGALSTAVEAIKAGAADFILKPWQNEKLLATLSMALNLHHSKSQLNSLQSRQREIIHKPSTAMVANAPVMQKLMEVVSRAAPTEVNILIHGENGTGKELIAQTIHQLSGRASEILLSVDLGAIVESLFESELFGHKKGAFTDAREDRAGRFQAAHSGTLFLDEISNLPLHMQSRLLRVLETREITPVGSDKTIPVDVRLICATNRPLEPMVQKERFREDLLYRINTVVIELPPLRERQEDIAPLSEYFIRMYAKKYHLEEKKLGPETLAAMCEYPWPGNIRELSHAIERAMVLSDGDKLSQQQLLPMTNSSSPASTSDSLNLEAQEKDLVETALSRYDGNISAAAKALGITRTALYRRIAKFHIKDR